MRTIKILFNKFVGEELTMQMEGWRDGVSPNFKGANYEAPTSARDQIPQESDQNLEAMLSSLQEISETSLGDRDPPGGGLWVVGCLLGVLKPMDLGRIQYIFLYIL